MMLPRLAIVLPFLLGTLATACAMRSPNKVEATPVSPPPPPDPTSSPSTLDKNLEEKKMKTEAEVPTTAATSGATPTIVDDIPHARLAFDQTEAAFAASGTDCAQMCKALASMQRAADHLCDLTKDGEDSDKQKCTDARTRLTSAKDRIAKVCGGCGPS